MERSIVLVKRTDSKSVSCSDRFVDSGLFEVVSQIRRGTNNDSVWRPEKNNTKEPRRSSQNQRSKTGSLCRQRLAIQKKRRETCIGVFEILLGSRRVYTARARAILAGGVNAGIPVRKVSEHSERPIVSRRVRAILTTTHVSGTRQPPKSLMLSAGLTASFWQPGSPLICFAPANNPKREQEPSSPSFP